MKNIASRASSRFDNGPAAPGTSAFSRSGVIGFTPGWMSQVLPAMIGSRAWIFPLSERTEVIPAQPYPMFTQATSAAAVANAAHVAVQGQAVKQFGSQGVVAASGVQYIDCGYGIAASQAALAGTPNNPVTVFGLRVKITNSPLNFKYGVYNVAVVDNLVGGKYTSGAAVNGSIPVTALSNVTWTPGTISTNVLAEAYVRPATNVADFVILCITTNGGQAGITAAKQPWLGINLAASSFNSGTAGTAQDFVSIESLNERDIGTMIDSRAISVTDAMR